MKIEMFDKVRLKTGETGNVVEIWDDGADYDVEMDGVDPFRDKKEWIKLVKHEDIVEVL